MECVLVYTAIIEDQWMGSDRTGYGDDGSICFAFRLGALLVDERRVAGQERGTVFDR